MEIKNYVNSKKVELEEIRYAFNLSDYLKSLRELLPSAEGKLIVSEFKASVESLLGPETDEDKLLKEELLKKKAKDESCKHKNIKNEGDESNVNAETNNESFL